MKFSTLGLCICSGFLLLANASDAASSLPAKQTIAAITGLPLQAKFPDLVKIVGKPTLDIGSGFHDYYYRLDDGSSLRVCCRTSDQSLISVTVFNDGTTTQLFPRSDTR
jgi:hypothetical protein